MRVLSRIKVNADMLRDAAGAVAIFAVLVALFWIAYGLGLSTGGDQLVRAV